MINTLGKILFCFLKKKKGIQNCLKSGNQGLKLAHDQSTHTIQIDQVDLEYIVSFIACQFKECVKLQAETIS